MKGPFFAHLDELRRRILTSLAVFFLVVLVCFNFTSRLLSWLIRPAGQLVFTSPGEAFGAHITVAVTAGFVLSFPFILYQLWMFAAAALKPDERRFIVFFGPLSLLFFLSGVAFAFFVAVPMAYRFLMGFASSELVPMVSVGNYMGFLGNMVVAFGVAFELPLVMAFLAKIGIATPEFLRQKRRHAVIIILIVAAVLTPPDVVSQVLLAAPMLALYELGIIFTRMAYKHKTP
ncbi:MAG TPA: twin-arginine translocase subunit TatC [Candidatus Omnitrophota bacterium]|nr:twin-arginine translocase subunit TatC [Candidatus Omnitrophota bacterium]